MANTLWAFTHKERQNNNLTFEVQFLNPVGSASGKIYYALSNTTVWDTGSLSFQELGDITGVRNESVNNNFIYTSGTVFWKDVINKYIYIKFVGEVDGDIYDQVNYISIGNAFQISNLFTKSGNYAVLNVNLLDANKSVLSLSFIDRLEFRVKYYDGLIEKNEVRLINLNDNDFRKFLIGAENIAVKSFDSVLVEDNGDETILSYNVNLSYIASGTTSINFDVVKQIDIQGIHGSLVFNGHIFCSGRNIGDLSHNFARISLSDPNDISYIDVTYPDGSRMSRFDQLVVANGFIYAMTSGFLIQINPVTLEWIRYNINSAGITGSIPIVGDLENVFILSDQWAYKIAASTLQNITQNDVNVIPLAEDSFKVSDYVDLKNSLVHSAVCDETYLYAAYTTGNNSEFAIVKINKNLMTFDSSGIVPATTDDMTQNDEFLFLGQEASYPALGYNFGAVGVRKSDLGLFPLGPLANSDLESMNTGKAVTSYASLFFGDYLFDFKTNGYFYLLDTTIANQWSTNIPGMVTRRVFQYDSFGINGVINDVVFDYSTQKFHAFVWVGNGGSASKYVTFSIPDLQIISKPEVEIGNYIQQGHEYEITGSVVSNGGTTITQAYFEIQDLQNQILQTIPLTEFSIGLKSAFISTSITVKYRLVAINSKGTAYSQFKTLEVAVPDPVYVIKGIVYYENDPAPDTHVSILDISSGDIIASIQTSETGEYLFSDLDKDKTYLIFGWKENLRIISKIRTPFVE